MKKLLCFCAVIALLAVGAVGIFQIAKPAAEPVAPVTDVTALVIHAEYNSIDQMDASHATDAVPEGGYVLINTGNVEDPVNAQVYIKRADGYELYCDLSGSKGEQGVQGLTGPAGATPLLRISDDAGMWELSYDAGASWTSTGVTAQGPQGEQGEKGDKGDTGARGPQGSSYVLTETDKQAIIDAVLAQIGSGDTGGDSSGGSSVYMYYWDSGASEYVYSESPSTSHEYQHTCTLCGAQYYDDSSIANIEVCQAPDCTRWDGSFTTENNPYYGGSGSESGSSAYYSSEPTSGFSNTPSPGASYNYYYNAPCGAILYVEADMNDYVMDCPHCSGYHSDITWSYS